MKSSNLRYEVEQEEIIKYQKNQSILYAFHTRNYYIFDFFTI